MTLQPSMRLTLYDSLPSIMKNSLSRDCFKSFLCGPSLILCVQSIRGSFKFFLIVMFSRSVYPVNFFVCILCITMHMHSVFYYYFVVFGRFLFDNFNTVTAMVKLSPPYYNCADVRLGLRPSGLSDIF
jgi:hypothetical protein